MSLNAALEKLAHSWWSTMSALPDAVVEDVSARLAALPPDQAARTVAATDVLVILADHLPADHPVLVAARHDDTRGGATLSHSDTWTELSALAATTTDEGSPEVAKLDPHDVAIVAGILAAWEPGAELDINAALRLWQLDRFLGRIARASGASDLRDWFSTPSVQLDGRSPRDLAAKGQFRRLDDLAASLESFPTT
jgi:hypothetical protein